MGGPLRLLAKGVPGQRCATQLGLRPEEVAGAR